MRISSSARIYPENCKIPTISEAEKTLITASNLLTSTKSAVPHTTKEKRRHEKALQDLTAITENTQDAREASTTTTTVSTSKYATSLMVIQRTPIIHQRWTRRNTPMPAIHEVNETNRENNTQQQSHTTKPTSLVPNRRRCQPLRVKKKRTVEGQLIGSKRNDAKNTSQKRIQSLINQQRERDCNVEQYTNVDRQIENVTNEECNIPVKKKTPMTC